MLTSSAGTRGLTLSLQHHQHHLWIQSFFFFEGIVPVGGRSFRFKAKMVDWRAVSGI